MIKARLTKQLAECDKRIAKATEQKRIIEATIAKERDAAIAIDTSPMSAKDLGELVADAARSHGGDCGRAGYAHTSESWKVFRKRLGELVARGCGTGGASEERDHLAAELASARAELERLRAAMPSESECIALGAALGVASCHAGLHGDISMVEKWLSRVEAARGGGR